MKYFLSLGRILYSLPLFIFGLNNLFFIEKSINSVPIYLPYPEYWVYFVSSAMIIASVFLVLNKFTKIIGILTASMLISFAFMVHFPGLLNLLSMQQSIIGFLKDLSMAGAALFIAFSENKVK